MSNFFRNPRLINLGKIGDSSLGYITVGESNSNIPFNIRRTYWTYFTPHNIERGGHAHKKLKQVIVAVCGIIELKLETLNGEIFNFVLDSPEKGLLIESTCWREIKFSHNAVLLCLASDKYSEDDYIRDYTSFISLRKTRAESIK